MGLIYYCFSLATDLQVKIKFLALFGHILYIRPLLVERKLELERIQQSNSQNNIYS